MRALARFAAIGVAGLLLYEAGMVDTTLRRTPSAPLACVVVALIAGALALLVRAARGTGAAEAAVASPPRGRRAMRAVWIAVSLASLLGLAWAFGGPGPALGDRTQFHNDAIALDECAARLLLRGRDPYVDLDVFRCYRALGLGPDRTTPLRAGLFAELARYPSDAELESVWIARSAGGDNHEFVTRPSYPAFALLYALPFAHFGWDPNVLSLLALVAAMGLVVLKTPSGLRPFALTALLGAACLTAFTIGGSHDPLYALPLIGAWLWREHRWSGVLLGIAIATKQLAWAFVPYLLIAVLAAQGWRAVRSRVLTAALVFAVVNLPFVVHDPAAWLAGILTPLTAPMFPLGAGLVALSINGVAAIPPTALTALAAAAELACLAVAWRARRSDPEVGITLALLPLFFAPRSLFSYFYLIPLFAAAAVARMPLGSLTPAAAGRSGALTLLAAPRAGTG